MKTLRLFLTILAIAAPVLGVSTCTRTVSRYEQALAITINGEQYSQVIERFGKPSVMEHPSPPFLRYATRGCSAPCVIRVWWEHPVLNGIEAWSVEFDDKNKVIDSTHWASP